MRAIKPNTRRRSPWRTVLLAFLAIVLGGAGTVAALAWLRIIDPAKLAFWKSKDNTIPADWVYIPMCSRPIPAYTAVTRDYLMDPKTAKWALVPTPPKMVPKGVITDMMKILGRVMAREKAAAYAFKESDFLPEGTTPGVAGGTPPGKLAITLDASKLRGVVYDLHAGDHVVLQSSTAVDMPGAGHSSGGRLGTSVVATPNTTLLPKGCVVTTLVEDGVVVTPARTRNMPVSSASLTQGVTNRTVPVQEIVIAVDPGEVRLLNQALDLKYEITCVVHSGRPVSPPAPAAPSPATGGAVQAIAGLAKAVLGGRNPAVAASRSAKTVNRATSETPVKEPAAREVTPGLDPMAQVRFVEVMIGKERQFVLFNGPGNSPVVASQDDGSAKTAAGVVPAVAVEENKQ